MYRGFNIHNDNKFGIYNKIGEELYIPKWTTVKSTLDNFSLTNAALNGSEIQQNWFEQINDVFIYSHKIETWQSV